MSEVWLPIPGLDFYEASSEGRIRSLDRYREFEGRWGWMRRFHRGRILKPKPKPNGWGLVYHCFCTDGDVYWQVNRAVCCAFHGPPPSAVHEAAHLDGDTNNNVPENLLWSTPVENASHKIAHGTVMCGERNHAARLREAAVPRIIERYAAGEKSQLLSIEFGVSVGTILGIVCGRRWRHVECEARAAAKSMARKNMLDQLAYNH